MNTLEKINQDLLEAMKSGDEKLRDILRYLKNAIQKKEIDTRTELSEQDIIAIIAKEIKSRKESIEQFLKGEREDLADKEKHEIEVLTKYLPEQISLEEVENIISKAIEETGAKTMTDMGKVMGKIVSQVQGKFDNSKISEIVRSKLS